MHPTINTTALWIDGGEKSSDQSRALAIDVQHATGIHMDDRPDMIATVLSRLCLSFHAVTYNKASR